MKLVTFAVPGVDGQMAGALIAADGQVVDLQRAHEQAHGSASPMLVSLQALIAAGDPASALAQGLIASSDPHYPAADVQLLAPLPVPEQIRDCMSFETHMVNAYGVMRKSRAAKTADPEKALKEFEEKGLFQVPEVFYKQPIYYKANRFSVIGPEADVRWPSYARLMDYELEFAAVIGKRGADISKAAAHEHIFGYTIFNDISARDAQGVEMPGLLGPAKGKDFDTGNIFGPCIVTSDEIDPYNLTMTARINGEEWSRGNSSTMHWGFDDLLVHISKSETLVPGELICSGTVGRGCGLELERYLQPNDVIELEIEGIGVLRNRIVKDGE